MSNKTAIQEMLASMGFQQNYIGRAFKIYEKNYGHSYNAEVITEIIFRLQNKDKALKAKRNSSLSKCPCGMYLKKLTAASCYTGSNGVLCNECLTGIDGNNFVYHCSAKKIAVHQLGYDLCVNCANKTSGWRHQHVDAWSCKELQAWIISLCIGNENEKKLLAAISEQEIGGAEFNSLEEVSDVMDSFEIKYRPAVQVYMALQRIRTKTFNNNRDGNDDSVLENAYDVPESKQQNNNFVMVNVAIDGWDCNKLQAWILKLNVDKIHAKKVADVIREQEITGEDFNSMEEVSEIMDSFEIGEIAAKKIFAALEKLRGNVTNVTDDNSNINNNNEDAETLIMRNVVITRDIDENENATDKNNDEIVAVPDKNPLKQAAANSNDSAPKAKHKMKGKLAAKFGHLNIDPTKMKVGATPPKRKQAKQKIDQSVALDKVTVSKKGRRKRTKKKVAIEEVEPQSVAVQPVTHSNVVENNNASNDHESYKNKKVKSWNNQDLLNWIKTIGLEAQWLQIMVEIIESNGCTGNDWFAVKNFKELAKTFNIKQPMLANRVFREFRKAKRNQVDNVEKVSANDEVKQQNTNIKPKKAKAFIIPPKPVVVHVWDMKGINDWTCKELNEWMKSLKLDRNNEKKVIEAISEQEVNGMDFNSIEETVDIMDSLEITNDCATKIFSALQKIRSNAKNSNT